jgi:manganese efflux pump family protein
MLALLVLSVGLAMDAVAVSLVRGAIGERRLLPALELGGAFGLAQGVMPLLGWGLSQALGTAFERVDHWIAFALLSGLGARMLWQASKPDAPPAAGPLRLLGLATAAFATSIDAAAAGLTFGVLEVSVTAACLTIGGTTAVLCTAGYLVGSQVSGRTGKWAEGLGGAVLIALGVKILAEHLAH